MNPVFVFVDRSPGAVNAAWRGARVARDRGLPLHVVALHPLHANLADAGAVADSLAAELRRKLQVQVSSQAIAGTLDHEGLEAARAASLLVVPSAFARGPWPLASPVLRMLRASGRPVLVVHGPAVASYRRVLAAVEPGVEACSLIAAGHALSRDPGMKVLHVLGTAHEETMRLLDVPEHAIRGQRERDGMRARSVLSHLIASAGAREGAKPVIAFGDAVQRILEQQVTVGAELLVLGKRPRTAIADALRSSVAQRVLRAARADLLVLPMPPRQPGAAWHRPGFVQRPAG